MKETPVSYEKLDKLETRKEFRKAIEEKKVLKTELKMLEEEKNLEKCQFIYYEWFGSLENDLNKMIKDCKKELEKDAKIALRSL